MPFGLWTPDGPRKHVLDWCTLAHLANTIELSMFSSYAAFCQSTLTSYHYQYCVAAEWRVGNLQQTTPCLDWFRAHCRTWATLTWSTSDTGVTCFTLSRWLNAAAGHQVVLVASGFSRPTNGLYFNCRDFASAHISMQCDCKSWKLRPSWELEKSC